MCSVQPCAMCVLAQLTKPSRRHSLIVFNLASALLNFCSYSLVLVNQTLYNAINCCLLLKFLLTISTVNANCNSDFKNVLM